MVEGAKADGTLSVPDAFAKMLLAEIAFKVPVTTTVFAVVLVSLVNPTPGPFTNFRVVKSGPTEYVLLLTVTKFSPELGPVPGVPPMVIV